MGSAADHGHDRYPLERDHAHVGDALVTVFLEVRIELDHRLDHGPVIAATQPVVTTSASEPEMAYWYVTGSRVNLRGGPGKSNAVVGQVTFGAEAEVLTDKDGWFQIRLADGSASGWIFGKFLGEKLPG